MENSLKMIKKHFKKIQGYSTPSKYTIYGFFFTTILTIGLFTVDKCLNTNSKVSFSEQMVAHFSNCKLNIYIHQLKNNCDSIFNEKELKTSAELIVDYSEKLESVAFAEYYLGNYKRAFQLWEINNGNDDPITQMFIGLHYIRGDELKRNEEKGITWIKKAAENDFIDAIIYLEWYFLDKKNYDETIVWAEKGVHLSDKVSIELYGDLNFFGLGTIKDLGNSIHWYKIAVEKFNSSHSMYRLGEIYFYGIGVEKNINSGINWFNRSAEFKDPRGLFFIGKSYFLGKHFNQNLEKGLIYLKQASELGNKNADVFLKEYQDKGMNGVLKNNSNSIYNEKNSLPDSIHFFDLKKPNISEN